MKLHLSSQQISTLWEIVRGAILQRPSPRQVLLFLQFCSHGLKNSRFRLLFSELLDLPQTMVCPLEAVARPTPRRRRVLGPSRTRAGPTATTKYVAGVVPTFLIPCWSFECTNPTEPGPRR